MPGATASATLIWPSVESVAPARSWRASSPSRPSHAIPVQTPPSSRPDLFTLWDFIAAHAELLDAPEMTEAASRFLGNAIAVAHPAARWRMTSEPEVGTSAMSIPVAGVLRAIVEHPEQRERFERCSPPGPRPTATTWRSSALAHHEVDVDLVVAPMAFARPPLAIPEFFDDDGRVIDYGSRWAGGSPPDDAYSRVSHPERFAPVLSVVDALVEHLATWYVDDVDRRVSESGARVMCLRPTTGATITLTVSAESVDIEAGALFRDRAPVCTCDACDETAESVADHLEQTLLAIAAGGLREVFPVGQRRWLHTRSTPPTAADDPVAASPTRRSPRSVSTRPPTFSTVSLTAGGRPGRCAPPSPDSPALTPRY